MNVDYSIYPTLLDSFYWAKRLGKWQELIDKINRVKPPGDYPESVLRGMSLEAIVNKCLQKQMPDINDFGYTDGKFSFQKPIVDKLVKKLCNNIGQQKYIQGQVTTGVGNVKVYGFVDYVYPDMFVDLKTSEKYIPGKYSINSQHKCYPLIGKKKSLTYLVTDFNDIYIEPYQFNAEVKDQFIFELTEFLEWLEENRNLITDTKIF